MASFGSANTGLHRSVWPCFDCWLPATSTPARLICTTRSTVYKTLNVLKEIDEVLELGFSHGDNRYDGKKPYPHPHLICTNCGKIVDSEASLTRNLVQEIAQSSGYQIVSHRLDFYGLCPDCQQGE